MYIMHLHTTIHVLMHLHISIHICNAFVHFLSHSHLVASSAHFPFPLNPFLPASPFDVSWWFCVLFFSFFPFLGGRVPYWILLEDFFYTILDEGVSVKVIIVEMKHHNQSQLGSEGLSVLSLP